MSIFISCHLFRLFPEDSFKSAESPGVWSRR